MAYASNNIFTDHDDNHVFGLLTRLSEILVKENSPSVPSKIQNWMIKKARSSLYETLLGKKYIREIAKQSEDIGHMSPVSWLIAQRSVLNHLGREEQSYELDNAIAEAFSLDWHNFPDPMLRMLICLTDSCSFTSARELPYYEPFSLSKKLGLTDKMSEQRTRLYPAISSDTFKPPPWMDINLSIPPFGGYKTSFPFNKEPGEDLPLFKTFSEVPSKRNLSVSSVYQLHPIPVLTGPRDLTSPSSMSQSNLEDEGYATPMTDVVNPSHIASEDDIEDPTQVWSDALKVSLPQLKSWETLGNLVTEAEPPFISAASLEATHHLSILINMYSNIFGTEQTCDPKPISRIEFVRDIFLLLIGIESINFPFVTESDCFVVRKGMWLEGYCVDDTSALCQDLLFCGTHFRRLEKFSHSSIIHGKDDGLMIKALKDCVQRWIQFYHGAILILSTHFKSKENSMLIYKLLECAQALKHQVYCVSRLCHVCGPTQDTSLPNGVALLAFMYREACMSNYQQSHLLYSALKSCCEVYLHCLQRWIFLGDCSENEANEFFIRRDPCFSNKRDRSFWTQGFVLDKSAVPEFLSGLEGAVFECGRAMNLLQLCSPQHPLCVLLEKRHPSIHCCLYKSDMETVVGECAQFETEAQRICGDFMNVSNLLEQENEQEAHLHVLMQKVQKERARARAVAKIRLEKERAEIKEKQNAVLKAQILETQQRKAAEKEQKRIEDELYLIECQRSEEAAKIVEAEEKQKIIAHYEELGKVVEKQNKHKEWQLKRLKMSDKRQTFLYEDSLNLARDFLLLDRNATIDQISGNHEIVTQSHSDHMEQPPLSSDTTDLPTHCYVPISKLSQDAVIQNQETDVSHVQDLSSDASATKAKVLQVQFGNVPENMTDNSNNANNSTNSDHNITFSIEENSNKTKVQDNGMEKKYNFDVMHSDLVRNRQKVLTEDVFWKSNDNMDIPKKNDKHSEKITTKFDKGFKKITKEIGEDSNTIPEWERNRQRVLDAEFDTITGVRKFDLRAKNISFLPEDMKESPRALSDLEKNRRKVLGEEFNTLTGEVSSQNNTASIPVVVINSDSGVFSSTTGDTEYSSSTEGKQRDVTKGLSDQSPIAVVSERPQLLSINSETSVLSSPFGTPLSMADMPVFTSPFKGTNHLPNELPLASPLLNTGMEKVGILVRGIPLMVDIADSFALKLYSYFENIPGKFIIGCQNTVSQENLNAEPTKVFPNTSWLESSLQTCLLLPLQVQHRYVSAALLNYFLVDLKLLSHFRSLRSYYFMQDGEFGRHLTVKMFSQMYKVSTPDELFNQFSLDKVIKEALIGSQGSADPNNDRLSLAVNSVPHHLSYSSPNVFDCLQLSYKVQWPLNLLLTPDALEKYNVIFVFLVRLKRVAWLLQEDFVALKNTARGCFKEQHRDLLNSPQYHQVQIIRHSMSQFVQATLNYVSSCVLHASWTDFASSLKDATTIDHIYNAHIEYIKRLLKRCLLNTNSKRVEAVLTKILISIIKFHGNIRVRPWQVPSKLSSQRSQSVHLEHPNFQNVLACSTHFKLQVSKLISYLERLISPPNQQEHLAEYLLLLNINGFYKSTDYLKHAENLHGDSEGKTATTARSVGRELLFAS